MNHLDAMYLREEHEKLRSECDSLREEVERLKSGQHERGDLWNEMTKLRTENSALKMIDADWRHATECETPNDALIKMNDDENKITQLKSAIKAAYEFAQELAAGVKWYPDTALKREANARREAAIELVAQLKPFLENSGGGK